MKYYSIRRNPKIKLENCYTIWALATERGNKGVVKITRSLFKNPSALGVVGYNLHDPYTSFEDESWKRYNITEISKQKYELYVKRIQERYEKERFLEAI